MREFKFRAWDKAKGKFTDFDDIGGYMLLSHDGNPTYFAKVLDGTIHPPYVGELKELIIIQQYTGLKDKNGVEIYEGDIVRVPSYPESYVTPVFFRDGSFGTYIEGTTLGDETGWLEISQNSHSTEDDFEVIGNIYENPELIDA